MDKIDLESYQANSQGQSTQSNENILWTRLIQASTPEGFCAAWLILQCRMIDGAVGGLVLLGKPEEGPYAPVAAWPNKANMQHLSGVAEKALHERRGLFVRGESHSGEQPTFHLAYPVEVSSRLYGVVVIEVGFRTDSELQIILRQLHWGIAWLENLFLRLDEGESIEANERLIKIMELVAVIVEQDGFQAAATAFVTDLAAQLSCERVSYGILKDNKIQISALSHSAEFGKKMNLMNAISSAMEEAVDQFSSIVFPEGSESKNLVSRAHLELSRQHGMGSICTIPLLHNDAILGALTLERGHDEPFDPPSVELCESLASLAGPILEDKRKEDRLLVTKIVDAFNRQTRKLIGPEHYGVKLGSFVLMVLLIFFSFAKGDYRVTSQSTIEGSVQRSIVAPFNGYVIEAEVRAGDLVKEGQPLSILDDRDLKIERLKWASQKEQLVKKYREAMAQHERAQVRILNAQIDQADAQIALIDEHLSRTRITAPFDSIVISGDLSQSLGAPVERGEVLFEVAPLDDYRIVLEVDEKDIDEIVTGQHGELVLSAMPDQILPFAVEKVTPVATAREGKNFFRVEAELQEASARLRPGMEGIGKINIDRRKLIWIWTHEVVDWIRLKFWALWP